MKTISMLAFKACVGGCKAIMDNSEPDSCDAATLVFRSSGDYLPRRGVTSVLGSRETIDGMDSFGVRK